MVGCGKTGAQNRASKRARERERKKEVVYTAYLIRISMPVCLWKTKYLFILKKGFLTINQCSHFIKHFISF